MKDDTYAKIMITAACVCLAGLTIGVCLFAQHEDSRIKQAPPTPAPPAPAPPADQQWRFSDGWTATTRVITLSTGERVLITHIGDGVSTLLLPPEPPPAVESPASKL